MYNATMTDQDDTTQTDGEGPDGSDKPPHDRRRPAQHLKSINGTSIPIPPPDSNAYEKQPGTTVLELTKLSLAASAVVAPPPPKITHTKELSLSNGSTSTASSPTVSESDWGSAPSTRPPSRAPSMSAGTSGGKVSSLAPTPKASARNGIKPPSSPPSKPPSVTDGGGHKFNLKDLLGSGPKLSRKSSQRSNGSSRRSDGGESDGERRGPRSTAGDSTTSLTQKYGVCQKLAIGKGATSVVRLAHKWDRSEERLYAVKEFRKRRKNETEKDYVKKLTAEFCISSTLHHVNIVETVDLVQDESQKWCEVMEFCPGGDLYAAIKKGGMSPSEVECCFKQILCGVSYLHSQGVAHRDLKPENLFFDTKGHLKIGDYGASTVYRLPWEATIHMSTGLCGSEPYIAPEQFLGKPYDARLVDIWACGVVYYCLHFQELPWRAAQPADAMYAAYASACQANPLPPLSKDKDKEKEKDKNQPMPSTINNLSPRACRLLIRQMLEPNPKRRLDIEAVMRDKWVQGIEVCHEVDKPHHVHVHAQSMVQAQLREVGYDR